MTTCVSAVRNYADSNDAESSHPLLIMLMRCFSLSGDGGRQEAQHQAEQHGDYHQEAAGPGEGA